MSSLTRSKIAYNLEVSPHRHTVLYDSGEMIEYVFSSNLYKRKFIEKRDGNRQKIEESLSNRFGVKVSAELLSDMRLYKHIEKRGFLLVKDKEVIKCPENVKLDGERMTLTN